MRQNHLFADQYLNLERVSDRIGYLVVRFLENRLATNPIFHASDLCRYVWGFEECAPESPGRIMRKLRLDGRVEVEVIDRSRAQYRVTAIYSEPRRA